VNASGTVGMIGTKVAIDQGRFSFQSSSLLLNSFKSFVNESDSLLGGQQPPTGTSIIFPDLCTVTKSD
jgi:hypothetical protein